MKKGFLGVALAVSAMARSATAEEEALTLPAINGDGSRIAAAGSENSQTASWVPSWIDVFDTGSGRVVTRAAVWTHADVAARSSGDPTVEGRTGERWSRHLEALRRGARRPTEVAYDSQGVASAVRHGHRRRRGDGKLESRRGAR